MSYVEGWQMRIKMETLGVHTTLNFYHHYEVLYEADYRTKGNEITYSLLPLNGWWLRFLQQFSFESKIREVVFRRIEPDIQPWIHTNFEFEDFIGFWLFTCKSLDDHILTTWYGEGNTGWKGWNQIGPLPWTFYNAGLLVPLATGYANDFNVRHIQMKTDALGNKVRGGIKLANNTVAPIYASQVRYWTGRNKHRRREQ